MIIKVRVIFSILGWGDFERHLMLLIEENLKFVLSREPLDHFVSIACQENVDLILSRGRKEMRNVRSAASAEREAGNVLFLGQVWRKSHRSLIRFPGMSSRGEAADLLRGTEVAFQQSRRKATYGNVVEPMAGFIRGKIL